MNKPGGLKTVTGGLLQFKPFHGHNVVVVACLKHLFFWLAILLVFQMKMHLNPHKPVFMPKEKD